MVNAYIYSLIIALCLGLVIVNGLKIYDEKCSCPLDADKDKYYCGHVLSPECFKHHAYKCSDGVGKRKVACIGVPCVVNHTNEDGIIVSAYCLPREEKKAYLEGNSHAKKI